VPRNERLRLCVAIRTLDRWLFHHSARLPPLSRTVCTAQSWPLLAQALCVHVCDTNLRADHAISSSRTRSCTDDHRQRSSTSSSSSSLYLSRYLRHFILLPPLYFWTSSARCPYIGLRFRRLSLPTASLRSIRSRHTQAQSSAASHGSGQRVSCLAGNSTWSHTSSSSAMAMLFVLAPTT
jgi:hypothetical protein